MSRCTIQEAGASLIELMMAALILSIAAAVAIPNYSTYRLRVERGNGEACLMRLARLQEGYYLRNNTYTDNLSQLGYNAAHSAHCRDSSQYLLTATALDTEQCPLSRCYRISAIPIGNQVNDGALHLTYDASQSDPNLRLKKERGNIGSHQPWR